MASDLFPYPTFFLLRRYPPRVVEPAILFFRQIQLEVHPVVSAVVARSPPLVGHSLGLRII